MAISFERAAQLVAQRKWTDRSANQFLIELKVVAGVEVSNVEPIEIYVRRWLEGQKNQVAPKTWANYEDIADGFLEFLKETRSAPMNQLTGRMLQNYRDCELKLGKAGTTINKSLSVLGQCFDDAVAAEVLSVNPARKIRVKGADKHAQQRKPFSFDQFASLLRCSAPDIPSARGHFVHPDWQPFILVAGYTGGRQQEVAQLRWQHVDFTDRVVRLQRTKPKRSEHIVPMHESLERGLLEAWNRAGQPTSGPVFPHISSMPERKVSRYFRETILPRAGISQPYAKREDGKGLGRKCADYTIHSLRHSCVTWLNAAGVDEFHRMKLVGHEDTDVNRVYTHAELTQLRTQMAKLPALP